jgi:A/G-specific adenine glycosylase
MACKSRPSLSTGAYPPRGASLSVDPSGLGFSASDFRSRLHKWYREHARDLPWRGVHDPYATWLSEIMLQQTRVATVIDRYCAFLLRFPTLRDLAEAEERDVLALWSGLGYYRRARLLHRGAQFVMRELKGKLPRTSVALRTLPGIGDYTAAAIASIAFGERIAVLDGNVERVLLRILGRPEERSSQARKSLAAVAQTLITPDGKRVPRSARIISPADHNQAMMELGATICLPRSPLCLQCPVTDLCKTRGEHVTLEREKQQSRVAAYLLTLRKRGVATEVLLERRSQDLSLMPGMLELPPLPLDAVTGREPVLRLRHAITNTNYYAQIFAEGASEAVQPAFEDPQFDEIGGDPSQEADDEAVVIANSKELAVVTTVAISLLQAVPAAAADLEWLPTTQLAQLPLTGLARKALQRLGVMALPEVRIHTAK